MFRGPLAQTRNTHGPLDYTNKKLYLAECRGCSCPSPEKRPAAGSIASPNILGGQLFWLQASNRILFETPPLKAQNDKIC